MQKTRRQTPLAPNASGVVKGRSLVWVFFAKLRPLAVRAMAELGAVRVLSEAVGDSDLGRLCERLLLLARAPLSLLRGQLDDAALRLQLPMLDELLRELAREAFTTWRICGTSSALEPASVRTAAVVADQSSGRNASSQWRDARAATPEPKRSRGGDGGPPLDAEVERRMRLHVETLRNDDITSKAADDAAHALWRYPYLGRISGAMEALRWHECRKRPSARAREAGEAHERADAHKAAQAREQACAREQAAVRLQAQAAAEQDAARLRPLIAALERETTADPMSDAAKAAAAELRDSRVASRGLGSIHRWGAQGAAREALLEEDARLRRLCAALDNEDPESDAAEAAAAELRRKRRRLPRRKLRESDSQRLTSRAASDLRLVIRAALDRHCEAAVTARQNHLEADYLTALVVELEQASADAEAYRELRSALPAAPFPAHLAAAGQEAPGTASLVQEKPEGSAPGLPEESEVPTAEASEVLAEAAADLAARVQLSGAPADLAARESDSESESESESASDSDSGSDSDSEDVCAAHRAEVKSFLQLMANVETHLPEDYTIDQELVIVHCRMGRSCSVLSGGGWAASRVPDLASSPFEDALAALTAKQLKLGRSYVKTLPCLAARERIWREGVSYAEVLTCGLAPEYQLSRLEVADLLRQPLYRNGSTPGISEAFTGFFTSSIFRPAYYFGRLRKAQKMVPRSTRRLVAALGRAGFRTAGAKLAVTYGPSPHADAAQATTCSKELGPLAARLVIKAVGDSDGCTAEFHSGKWEGGDACSLRPLPRAECLLLPAAAVAPNPARLSGQGRRPAPWHSAYATPQRPGVSLIIDIYYPPSGVPAAGATTLPKLQATLTGSLHAQPGWVPPAEAALSPGLLASLAKEAGQRSQPLR
ncbi:hypothetical protein EMIHUDRAFT_203289 [Emiliania huxleyi CCMP1516]|uniref:Uncharacterized protein n=2 Tax=Emiliania huxleyi TaxID=2903 RepID=A0A0D3K5W5_EMIH1|nr:hypothetical protein EMIHUDRAFT_203289 [Emiliania huxleyi CCMP1516]EOD31150.1 hypothetical protein EMIHUDRAFT_203289 [Emiliania huxleyi CCMP1516]|eukprot:XP_005783579.1 hypothetical protein EMIHUDRAFT_203289 [Emiliania huxleyi CCMP1516]